VEREAFTEKNEWSVTLTQFHELFSYMHLNFSIYYLSVPIFLVNLFKLLRNSSLDKKAIVIDLVIDFLLLAGVVGGLVFQGALLDMTNESTNPWVARLLAIGMIDFVLFLVQLIFVMKKTR